MSDILDRLEAETHRSGMWADTCLLLDEAAEALRNMTRERDEARASWLKLSDDLAWVKYSDADERVAMKHRAETAERERDELRAKLAAERERCAKIAEGRHELWKMPHPDDAKPFEVCDDISACRDIAAAIRAEQAPP